MPTQRHAPWEGLLPLLYLAWMLTGGGVLSAFELNPDEGVNVIKAWLLAQGHPLYTAIWSDQPPVLTYLLSALINLIGPSVAGPRLLMLLASAGFLWGLGRHLRATAGVSQALAAQTLILTQPAFYFFGGAIMVGLPALYLAFAASFALLRARATPRRGWLLLSMVLMSLSLMTKLFTAVVIPVAVLYLLAAPRPSEGSPYAVRRVYVALFWLLGVAVLVSVLFVTFIGAENVTQLVTNHWRARAQGSGQLWPQQTLRLHLDRLPWLLPLAALGTGFALYRRDAARLFFAGWTGLAALALHTHTPVWQHQLLLVTLPAALLGGYGLGEGLTLVARRVWPGWHSGWCTHLALSALALVLIGYVWHESQHSLDGSRLALRTQDPMVQALLQPLAQPDAAPVITDRPMLVYRAGRRTPPWIAALTQKRMATGELTEADLTAEIGNHEPAQVLLARFPWPALRSALAPAYEVSISNALGTLYQRSAPTSHLEWAATVQRDWQRTLRRPASWYRSGEARWVADHIVRTQGPHGGWAKRMGPYGVMDLPGPPKDADDETLDNDATLAQLRFLLRVLPAHDRAAYRTALQRGVDYLLQSQYPSGGWPQIYPHLFSYHALATLNDGVTIQAARFLLQVRTSGWVTDDQRDKCGQAVQRTVDFLVRAQIRIQGRATGWSQQMDPVTLAPRPARAFEPAALASRETAQVLAFLMDLPAPAPEVVAAVHAGAAWLDGVRIEGLRIEDLHQDEFPHGVHRRVVADEQAPALWARFYDLEHQQPIFVGRDGLLHARLDEIEPERRSGYEFYVRDPGPLLAQVYPDWCRRHPPASSGN